MVQIHPVLGDIESNTDKMLRFIDGAADIICFPEMCLTGYDSKESWKHSINEGHDCIQKIRKASKEYGAVIVFGFPESSRERVFITQAISLPDGELALYRKTHLGRFEKEHFIQGDSFTCVGSERTNIGIQLCWESHIPEISGCLRKMGAELILMPHASFKDPKERVEMWKRYLPARAYDNRVFVAACDMIGNGRGGGILIIDPDGKVVDECVSGHECAVDCTLDAERLKRSSPDDKGPMGMKGADFFAARRPELYGDLIKIIQ